MRRRSGGVSQESGRSASQWHLFQLWCRARKRTELLLLLLPLVLLMAVVLFLLLLLRLLR